MSSSDELLTRRWPANACPFFRAGATRRQNNGMYHAAVTSHMSHKLVKETKKRIIAREKAAESNRKAVGSNDPSSAPQDDPENDGGLEPTLVGRWLEPETRVMRRTAKHMQGVRSDSVERLENDDLHHISAQRPYFKSGSISCPRPFGRRLIEDRWEKKRPQYEVLVGGRGNQVAITIWWLDPRTVGSFLVPRRLTSFTQALPCKENVGWATDRMLRNVSCNMTIR